VQHTEAFSFQISATDQPQTDRYWNAVVGNSGKESQCGWCKDKWGVSWQITPVVLTEGLADPDPALSQRVRGNRLSNKRRHEGCLSISAFRE
jgi:2-polyprenyl-6-hydroxyphenyl methylase/3-demethylubiquinone-9 3-methyltransferase